jgi:hypothetical protein
MKNKYVEDNRTLALATILMLLFILTLLFWGMNSGLDDNEAEALWIVGDDTALNGSPREIARTFRSNFSQMSERIDMQEQSPRAPLYFIMLDAWQIIAGDSVYAARTLSMLAVLLAMSVTVSAAKLFEPDSNVIISLMLLCVLYLYPAMTIYTYGLLLLFSALSTLFLIRYHHHPTKFNKVLFFVTFFAALLTFNITTLVVVVLPIIVIGIGWLLAHYRTITRSLPYDVMLLAIVISVAIIANISLLSARPDWPGAMKAFNRSRRAGEPIIMAFDQKSPLAHYYRQDTSDIDQGIAVDVGWRDFSGEEIKEIVDAIDATISVWIIMPIGDERTAAAIDALAYNRWLAYRLEEGTFLFYRFDYLPDDPRDR